MAIFAPIPMPKTGYEAFDEGLAKSQDIFNALVNNKLNQAKAVREQKMAELPFGGANVPGPAGQIVGLEMIRQQYGEDSPQYKQAANSFNLSQQSDQSRINYQNTLANTMPQRILTTQGKEFVEESNVGQGASPTGTPIGKPVVPGAPPYRSPYPSNKEAEDQYKLHRLKENVPNTQLTSSIRGTNAEQTLENINVDDLTHYSGLQGGINLIKDAKDAAMGNPSEQYVNYQSALTNAKLLAKQYRQMMGDSITPSNQKALNYLTDPTSWITNPKAAKSMFNTFAETLKRENKVFKESTSTPEVYTGKKTETQKNTHRGYTEEEMQGQEPAPGSIWMKSKKTGLHYQIHESNKDEAIKRGLEEVE